MRGGGIIYHVGEKNNQLNLKSNMRWGISEIFHEKLIVVSFNAILYLLLWSCIYKNTINLIVY